MFPLAKGGGRRGWGGGGRGGGSSLHVNEALGPSSRRSVLVFNDFDGEGNRWEGKWNGGVMHDVMWFAKQDQLCRLNEVQDTIINSILEVKSMN